MLSVIVTIETILSVLITVIEDAAMWARTVDEYENCNLRGRAVVRSVT